MIVSKPDVIRSGLYNMSQTAEILQVSRHTIARYAKLGMLEFKVRKADGKKVTTGSEIIRCWSGL